MTQEAYMLTQSGYTSNFLINCATQNTELKLETLTLIPCQASRSSQRNQKSELIERVRQSTVAHPPQAKRYSFFNVYHL
jgi:hypothetical protein